ncbi:hypothetical protein GEMRC1_002638 [Eukaryota sp. GEM-RC1]
MSDSVLYERFHTSRHSATLNLPHAKGRSALKLSLSLSLILFLLLGIAFVLLFPRSDDLKLAVSVVLAHDFSRVRITAYQLNNQDFDTAFQVEIDRILSTLKIEYEVILPKTNNGKQNNLNFLLRLARQGSLNQVNNNDVIELQIPNVSFFIQNFDNSKTISARQTSFSQNSVLLLTLSNELLALGSNRRGELAYPPSFYHQTVFQISLDNALKCDSSYFHNVFLTTNGRVFHSGTLRNTAPRADSHSYVPVPIRIDQVVDVAARSDGFSYAVRSTGHVFSWTTHTQIPSRISELTDIIQISAGYGHVLALDSEGDVFSFGSNSNGQLGRGNYVDDETPIKIDGLSNVTMISTGSWHSLALTESGDLFAFGANHFGQLGTQSREHFNQPQHVLKDFSWISISAGVTHSVVLREDMRAVSFGTNYQGQLMLGFTSLFSHPSEITAVDDVVSVFAGKITVLVNSNGQVFSSGEWNLLGAGVYSNSPNPVQILNFEQPHHVSLGLDHVILVSLTRSFYGYGFNYDGELASGNWEISFPRLLSDGVGDVSVGDGHVLVLNQNLTISSSGWNRYGQLGDGSRVQQQHFVGVVFPITERFLQIQAGQHSSFALDSSGRVWGWGSNQENQLLIDDPLTMSPVLIDLPLSVDQISSHHQHVLVRGGSDLYCWGSNSFGECGLGHRDVITSPSRVPLTSNDFFFASNQFSLSGDGNELYGFGKILKVYWVLLQWIYCGLPILL